MCYYCGFYINLLKCDNHRPTSYFLDKMYGNSFYTKITNATRLNNISAILTVNPQMPIVNLVTRGGLIQPP
jgi:hypothetical protein